MLSRQLCSGARCSFWHKVSRQLFTCLSYAPDEKCTHVLSLFCFRSPIKQYARAKGFRKILHQLNATNFEFYRIFLCRQCPPYIGFSSRWLRAMRSWRSYAKSRFSCSPSGASKERTRKKPATSNNHKQKKASSTR